MNLDVAVVGAGKIGRTHARILASMPDATVSHVVDVDAEAASELAAAVDAVDGTELEPALSDAEALFVCTPDDAHADIAERALAAEVHTFVEKPLATRLDEADALVAAATDGDGVHMVGHVLRYDPRYQALKRRVDARLGRVLSATADRLVPRARARRTDAVSRPPMRLGVHDFDLLEWVTGEPVVEVGATATDGALRDEGYDTEDVVSVSATFEGGWRASLTMGYCVPDGHPGAIVRTRVVGTDGLASVDGSDGSVQLWDADGGTYADTHLWPTVEGVPDGALANEDRAFVRAVLGDGPAPIPFSAGRRAVAVARAVERAVDAGRPVPVE